jgi:hypothetical protein
MGSALPEQSGGRLAGDAQQVRQEIELTRERLGAAVEQLAAKADVKSRARARAAELAGRIKGAAARGRQAAPRSVRQAMSKGASTAREHWAPLSLVAGAVLAVTALAVWQRGKR